MMKEIKEMTPSAEDNRFLNVFWVVIQKLLNDMYLVSGQ